MEMQSCKTVEEEEEERRRKWKWPLMKAAQLLEFQMQALVYRYLEAGVCVPRHLVVSIWNSLALSSSPSKNYMDHNNHSSSLLSEPTRCRRTDGKKWRCSNTVLLYQKYCERHIHRGSKRSRKLVESTKQDNTYGLDRSQSVHSNAQVVTIASLPITKACDNVSFPSLVISESTNKSLRRKKMEMSYDEFIKQRDSSSCVRVVPVQGNEDESLPCVQKFFPEVSDISLEAKTVSSIKKKDIIARNREWSVNGGLFSPHTVIQGNFKHQQTNIETDNEPGRCRRTDGKKWRCSKDVLFGQKYCEKHMHRGIKKKHPVAIRSLVCEDGDGDKLSVPVLGIQLSRVSDEKSTNSCSTDTTITDIALRGEKDNEEESTLCSSGV